MSFFVDTFTKADASNSLGTGWSLFTAYTGGTPASNTWGVSTNQAIARGTSTNLALATGLTQTGSSSFARFVQPASLGASVSALVNATATSAADLAGYALRDNGTDLALLKFVAGTPTTLANVAYTRTAGQELVLTAEHTTGQVVLKAWAGVAVDTATAPLLTHTDSSSVITGGKPGMRNASTGNVLYDTFRGGDLADMPAAVAASGSTISAGGIVDGATVVLVSNQAPADGIPTWRGLRYDRAGAMIVNGDRLHRQHFDFLGAAGAFTPPAGLTVTVGTATLAGADTGVGSLQLTTGATSGDKARVEFAYPIATAQHAAILVELGQVWFTASSPAADFRLLASDGLAAGGGFSHLNADATAFLHCGGEANRTRTPVTVLGADAARRRTYSLLVLPATDELFLLERDKVIGYRDGATTWQDGTVTVALEVTTRSAAAVSLRLTSLTVSTFA